MSPEAGSAPKPPAEGSPEAAALEAKAKAELEQAKKEITDAQEDAKAKEEEKAPEPEAKVLTKAEQKALEKGLTVHEDIGEPRDAPAPGPYVKKSGDSWKAYTADGRFVGRYPTRTKAEQALKRA